MTTTLISRPASGGVRVKGLSPWVWALRRTLMGLAILAITVGGAAWLLYAAIDPDIDANADARASLAKPPVAVTGSTTTGPQRLMVAQ